MVLCSSVDCAEPNSIQAKATAEPIPASEPIGIAEVPIEEKMSNTHELKPHPTIPKSDGPVLVCILDGFGENEFKDEFNAVHSAATPTIDAFRGVSNRSRTVRAHGLAVGLPSVRSMHLMILCCPIINFTD